MRRGGSARERRLAAAAAADPPDPRPVICLRGLPFEAKNDDVLAVLTAARPQLYLEEVFLHLATDRQGRPNGNAFVRLPETVSMAVALGALSGRWIGRRYLETRPSSEQELSVVVSMTRHAQAQACTRSPQAFLGMPSRLSVAPLESVRDVVVICHDVPQFVAQGAFALNDLSAGRVDLMARCIAATLCYSHGVRKRSRIWLHMANWKRTVCCDGGRARSVKPDERTIASSMHRALSGSPLRTEVATEPGGLRPGEEATVATETPCGAEHGWLVRDGDALEPLLLSLLAEAVVASGAPSEGAASGLLVALDEDGANLRNVLDAQQPLACGRGVVLVLGDHKGYAALDEQALDRLGAVRACLGPLPLLTSQCIILCHNVLDCLVAEPQQAGPTENGD